MKRFKTFSMSLCLTALVFTGLGLNFATAGPGKKSGKALTKCEAMNLKYKPQVDAFTKAFIAVPIFNAKAALGNIAQGDIMSAKYKFAALSPDKRRAVWKAKFDQIDLADYTDSQKAFIDKVVVSLDSTKFDGTDDQDGGKALLAEAKAIFKRSELKELFATLRTNASLMNAKSFETLPCECASGADDWCNWGDYCQATAACIRVFGCGWLMTWYCNGKCKPE